MNEPLHYAEMLKEFVAWYIEAVNKKAEQSIIDGYILCICWATEMMKESNKHFKLINGK